MGHLTANDAVLDFFCGVVEPVEIRDSEGHVLGHYTPVASSKEAALYAKARALFDPEEIKRRKDRSRGEKGHSFDEVMRHLRTLESKG